jgi:hypothetical protein
MPTVDTYSVWIDSPGLTHFVFRFNIDMKGQFSCKLPEMLAKRAGKPKVTGLALNMVREEVRKLVRDCQDEYRKKQL